MFSSFMLGMGALFYARVLVPNLSSLLYLGQRGCLVRWTAGTWGIGGLSRGTWRGPCGRRCRRTGTGGPPWKACKNLRSFTDRRALCVVVVAVVGRHVASGRCCDASCRHVSTHAGASSTTSVLCPPARSPFFPVPPAAVLARFCSEVRVPCCGEYLTNMLLPHQCCWCLRRNCRRRRRRSTISPVFRVMATTTTPPPGAPVRAETREDRGARRPPTQDHHRVGVRPNARTASAAQYVGARR